MYRGFFAVFNDELSKFMKATMAMWWCEGICSTNNLPLCVLDRSFDAGDQHIDVGEINNIVKDENDATAKTSFTHFQKYIIFLFLH